ncbi:hypothetical protein D9V34_08035 [Mycetocola lacteus]|uniref:Uncharacterized protein n=2 Tax=Mycetocola lacteus TaxID=76637 RepID=A0A3L7AUD8_9MICO|nr:hypothetical protein D9V34_08035 [Mycetocola lacteus]
MAQRIHIDAAGIKNLGTRIGDAAAVADGEFAIPARGGDLDLTRAGARFARTFTEDLARLRADAEEFRGRILLTAEHFDTHEQAVDRSVRAILQGPVFQGPLLQSPLLQSPPLRGPQLSRAPGAPAGVPADQGGRSPFTPGIAVPGTAAPGAANSGATVPGTAGEDSSGRRG